MTRREDLQVGMTVNGLVTGQRAVIKSLDWMGSLLEVLYVTEDGSTGSQLLMKDQESEIEIVTAARHLLFDADPDLMKLASEAQRIRLAHLFDPNLAVNTSLIEPLPHQITAVYETMLSKQPLRFLLADDPGAGKTIMTGLLIKELMIRGDVRRCLIITPGNLVTQWVEDELLPKFGLEFELLTNDRIDSTRTGNPFLDMPLCVARLDKLARDDRLKEMLRASQWDLVVCDEAHKMSATVYGGEVNRTLRYRLGELLSSITRHFLLLTATPHNGKENEFQLFMRLLDADRFEGSKRNPDAVDLSGMMRRMVKEELLTFEGKHLFPLREAHTARFSLSREEQELYEDVTRYVREGFALAERLQNQGKRNAVGFALQILQRRLASSPEAICQSLRRRRERLEERYRTLTHNMGEDGAYGQYENGIDDDFYDRDEEEISQDEEDILDHATAARTREELGKEIGELKELEKSAQHVLALGCDSKWVQLLSLLENDSLMRDEQGRRHKLIIFTEHRDTIHHLQRCIGRLLGDPSKVITILGGMNRDARRMAEASFKQDPHVEILLATDAAGEGINLQRAHLMINYDIPWNPNRIEQRFGRIHRIGQKFTCHMWNMVAEGTREGDVFLRLFEKLQKQREALGGRVFDVLGSITYDEKSLGELLMEAVLNDSTPQRLHYLDEVIENALDMDHLNALLRSDVLATDTLPMGRVMEIREEMERNTARRLQPYHIEAFFLNAFKKLGGNARRLGSHLYEIRYVPACLKDCDAMGRKRHVLDRYEQVTFDKDVLKETGMSTTDLICPGHPLLDAVIDVTLSRYSPLLKQGAILVDDGENGTEPRLLWYISHTICDGTQVHGEALKVSQRMFFVEMQSSGVAQLAGNAPYLDYRAPTAQELEKARKIAQEFGGAELDVEKQAIRFAATHLVPGHFEEKQRERSEYIDKVKQAVNTRLSREILYQETREQQYREKARDGKEGAKLQADNAAGLVKQLRDRLQNRLAELERQRRLYNQSPVLVGTALVIPAVLLRGEGVPDVFAQLNRKRMEGIAMRRVMEIERSLGHEPSDVSAQKLGWDVESRVRDGEQTYALLIEVKGRQADADIVTITRNEEIIGFNQPERFRLAIVQVDGDKIEAVYLTRPFTQPPAPTAGSTNHEIQKLIAGAMKAERY